MYIAARIIGLSVYILVAICLLFSVRMTKCGKASDAIYFSVLIVLCCMAFLYAPPPEADLFRLKQYAADCAYTPWGELLFSPANAKSSIANEPITKIILKLVGMTGISGFLPAFSCVVCYGSVFGIMCAIQKRFQLSGACMSRVLFVIMAADFYQPIISNVRSYIAASLVFLCVYRESKHERIDLVNILIYIMALLTHGSAALLIAIRIMAAVFQFRKSFIERVLCILFIGCSMAYLLFSSRIDYFNFITNTFVSYLTGVSKDNQYVYEWEYLILSIMLVLQIYTLLRFGRQKLSENSFLSSFYMASIFSTLASVLLCFQFTMFMRLCYYTTLLEIPLMLIANENVDVEPLSITANPYLLGAITMLILTCSRGYLCSLKFW